MNKKERKELFNKLKQLPKAVQNCLTAEHLERHIKIMKGVCHG